VRKWERKYILTTELAVKVVYGWLIKLGTRSAYEPPKPETAVVAGNLPEGISNRLPEVKVVKNLPGSLTLLKLPRYAPFGTNVCELAMEGVEFREVAGNTSAILITVIAPDTWTPKSEHFGAIFNQPIPTRAGFNRVAMATPVKLLHKTLRELQMQKIEIEHIYDF
jgi:hypothetical protein